MTESVSKPEGVAPDAHPHDEVSLDKAIEALGDTRVDRKDIERRIRQIADDYRAEIEAEELLSSGKTLDPKTPNEYRSRIEAPVVTAKKLALQIRRSATAFRRADAHLNLLGRPEQQDWSVAFEKQQRTLTDWISLAERVSRYADEVEELVARWPADFAKGRGTWSTVTQGNPKGRLAMDCGRLFSEVSGRPGKGERSRFYQFVEAVHDCATAEEGRGLVRYVNDVATYYQQLEASEGRRSELRIAHEDGELSDEQLRAATIATYPRPPYPL